MFQQSEPKRTSRVLSCFTADLTCTSGLATSVRCSKVWSMRIDRSLLPDCSYFRFFENPWLRGQVGECSCTVMNPTGSQKRCAWTVNGYSQVAQLWVCSRLRFKTRRDKSVCLEATFAIRVQLSAKCLCSLCNGLSMKALTGNECAHCIR